MSMFGAKADQGWAQTFGSCIKIFSETETGTNFEVIIPSFQEGCLEKSCNSCNSAVFLVVCNMLLFIYVNYASVKSATLPASHKVQLLSW